MKFHMYLVMLLSLQAVFIDAVKKPAFISSNHRRQVIKAALQKKNDLGEESLTEIEKKYARSYEKELAASKIRGQRYAARRKDAVQARNQGLILTADQIKLLRSLDKKMSKTRKGIENLSVLLVQKAEQNNNEIEIDEIDKDIQVYFNDDLESQGE